LKRWEYIGLPYTIAFSHAASLLTRAPESTKEKGQPSHYDHREVEQLYLEELT
jgi:hypothetical protein